MLFDFVESHLDTQYLKWSDVGLSEHSGEIGRHDIYIARQGNMVHGIQFADIAFQYGAILIVCEDTANARQFVHAHLESDSDRIYFSSDFDHEVKMLVDRVYGGVTNNVSLIGITGTNGKTSTAYILASLLSADGEKAGLIGTSGYGVIGETLQSTRNTTPDYISVRRYISQLVSRGCRYIVMEVSSHAIALERIAGLEFEIKVFTNFSRDHLDFHGDMEQYRKVKESFVLTHDGATVVVNTDDPVGFGMCEGLSGAVNVLGYGFNAPLKCVASYMKCISITPISEGGQLIEIDHDGKRLTFSTDLCGKFNVYNFMAAVLAAKTFGITSERVEERAKEIRPIEGRAQRVSGSSGTHVYVDYAHTPDGISSVLNDLAGMDTNTGDVWCMFGCGGDRDRGKRGEMGRVATGLSDRIVICDDNTRTELPEKILVDIMSGVQRKVGAVICRDREMAIRHISQQANENDIVFLLGKGSESSVDYGKTKLPLSDIDMVRRYF